MYDAEGFIAFTESVASGKPLMLQEVHSAGAMSEWPLTVLPRRNGYWCATTGRILLFRPGRYAHGDIPT